jgi:type VI secretion system FHA domain protein
MVLMLSVLRCPDSAMPGTRRVEGGDFSLGRGEGCDWMLADPERVLSKRHCTLEFRSGGWQVRDLSTNGTFVNRATAPVGRDMVAPLNDGDRLRLGAYELEVRIEQDAASPWNSGGQGFAPAPAPMDDPFAGLGTPAPNPPPLGAPGSFDGLGLPPLGDPSAPAGSAPGFGAPPASPFAPPMDFDPLGPPGTPGFGTSPPPAWSDHSPAASDAFVPPRANFGAELPADWNTPPPAPPATEPDWDKLLGDFVPPPSTSPFGAPQAAPPSFAPAPPARPDPFAPTPAAPDPFAPSPAAFHPPKIPASPIAVPSPLTPEPFGAVPPPAAPDPFSPPATPAPAASPAAAPFSPAMPSTVAAPAPPPAWPAAASSSPFDEPPGVPGFVPPTAPPVPPPDSNTVALPVATGDANAALAALLRGAGLGPLPPGTDPLAALEAAGAALRAAVSGLRGLLIARADVKRAFRIEQTMLSRRDNNPVKFAATDEASVASLLGAGPKRGPAAVEDTVSDLTLHQVATLAATQAAARALLERLAPSEVESAHPGGGILPGAREKRLWDGYRGMHAKLLEQFEDDFDSAFGRAFARAYETAAREAGRSGE